jgi:hypothetical protein
MKKQTFIAIVVSCLGLSGFAHADTKTTKSKKAKSASPSVTAPDPSVAATPKAAIAPAPVPGTVKQAGQGEMTATVTGTNKEKLVIGKLDPPAAFNLEDIQNFPEDRLQPLLNAPVTFKEGRDFSKLMDFKEDQPVHPWLPEIAQTPFLAMKSPQLDKAAKEWEFAIIDQGGATVSKQEGKGTPPDQLVWKGDDSQRGLVAVDTVYIPQLNTVDKEGYHHTYMGQPIQFSSIEYSENGKTTIELSTKRLFAERKGEFSKEGPLLLDKVCDVIREGSHLPFAIQPYSADDSLGKTRRDALSKYFRDKLFIPENQIVSSMPQDPSKRGEAMAIISTSVPGGSDK